jgi:omega-amidase
MLVGVFQFHGKGMENNFEAIAGAVAGAAQKGVRLLVFHECALTGYPPVEIPGVYEIDFDAMESRLNEIRELAKEHGMYLALGMIRREGSDCYNSIRLIGPDGEIAGNYDKRALWGWDLDNFAPGGASGIYEIDGIRVGFRICYEIRFPEYFRELFRSKVHLCFVSFYDVSRQDFPERYDTIKAHLISRAAENAMTVVSVNCASQYQTAPTAVFDVDGRVVSEAPVNGDCLLTYSYEIPEYGFGARGRIKHSAELQKQV